jgi:hypothetical protein
VRDLSLGALSAPPLASRLSLSSPSATSVPHLQRLSSTARFSRKSFCRWTYFMIVKMKATPFTEMSPAEFEAFLNGPSSPPPPMTIPNLVNPDSLSTEFIVLCTVCAIVTGLALAIRLYTRWTLIGRSGRMVSLNTEPRGSLTKSFSSLMPCSDSHHGLGKQTSDAPQIEYYID